MSETPDAPEVEEPCPHERFKAVANTHRYAKNGETAPSFYVTELTIQCAFCRAKFAFVGLPPAEKGNLMVPTVSPDGLTARLPVVLTSEVPTITGTAEVALRPGGGDKSH